MSHVAEWDSLPDLSTVSLVLLLLVGLPLFPHLGSKSFQLHLLDQHIEACADGEGDEIEENRPYLGVEVFLGDEDRDGG